jgi:hypothetical protein
MTSSHLPPSPCQWFPRLASALDRRSAPRLVLLLFGAVLARGRGTVTGWIRATGLRNQFRPCYTTVAAAGNTVRPLSAIGYVTPADKLDGREEEIWSERKRTPAAAEARRHAAHAQESAATHP